MYRYAKHQGERNSRYGVVQRLQIDRLSDETRQKMREAALRRERKPRAKRSDTPTAGREYARRWFPMPALCERCHLVPPLDRHHRDGNPQNNDPSNISCLCRRCHQIEDGRHERLLHEIPSLGGKARNRR